MIHIIENLQGLVHWMEQFKGSPEKGGLRLVPIDDLDVELIRRAIETLKSREADDV